ncbi:MAG TPA: glycosyltransferase family 8 protein [Solirubrobacteraceae bacterium]|nr:glycosyltransferase family 8 protein [Solirubrobacteraceae bacterium]
MSVLHVATAAEDYLPQAAAMLHSVLARRGELEVQAHLLHGPRLRPRERERLRRVVEGGGAAIAFHAFTDAQVAGLPAPARFTPAVWYSAFLPERLPHADRVLVLDADTIAADDLSPLWETRLEGDLIAAVTNVFQPDHAFHAARLGVDARAYFNSGVLLMDLAALRRTGAMEEVLAYARAHPDQLPWADQDALNVVLGDARRALHPRWNCMNALFAFPHAGEVLGAEAVREARAGPGIRHFEGPGANKPWRLRSRVPHRELYRTHARAAWPRRPFRA